ncbi:Uncharacterised protein [Xylophilus ampelinus]|nr:DUF4148 domain-containing protein [Variovorax sp.]VTY34742.1 Uncharacterised protein [Xylophilus ampelinus]|tara:strand:+ start:409 stop:792 length:384 start_codon:yes stop_codon:yes gene_type:complete
MRNAYRHVATLAAATAAAFFLSPAMAAGAFHPQNGEVGATFHPDHVSSKSRDQVNTELVAATQLPAWQPLISRGAPWPIAKTGPGLTREQVNAELQAAMKTPAWDRVGRLGAPWPTPAVTGSQASTR